MKISIERDQTDNKKDCYQCHKILTTSKIKCKMSEPKSDFVESVVAEATEKMAELETGLN